MVFMGILMFTGKMNAVTGYLSSIPSPTATESREAPEPETAAEASEEESPSEPEKKPGKQMKRNSFFRQLILP